MIKQTVSRRDFLKLANAVILAACSLLGLDGLIRFLNTSIEPSPKSEFDLGSIDQYPPGTRTSLPEVPAILLHEASGFSAISLICTHLGCTVQSKPEGFVCPCHGSRFDQNGNITRGPASKPLPRLRVEVTSEKKLRLYTN
jgi:cytochrome b6-f complex iron-sulfur subunit